MDLVISMEVEMLDSSKPKSLTDRLGAGQRKRNTLTRGTSGCKNVSKTDLSIKKVLAAKNCAAVGTKPVSDSVLQHCKLSGLVFCSTDHGSHAPLQDEGD